MPDLVARAEALARRLHAHQRRKGAAAEPYALHLEEVAGFVARHGGDDIAIAAAWLHDTVEDCPPFSNADIAAAFGPEVAAVVAELTDDKSLPKAERKRLQLAHAPGRSARAGLVKLGDKWSNIRAVGQSAPAHWPDDRRRAYVDWAMSVAEALDRAPAPAMAELQEAAAATRQAIGPRDL